jgi:hypothetical protein
MKVRFDAAPICECGDAMVFADPKTVIPRRIFCINPKCEHFGLNYFEPTTWVELE